MAKLYLKGVQKPFTIETQTAIVLNKILEDKSIPTDKQFNKNGLRFSKSDIRYVIENDPEDNQAESSEKKKVENDTYYSDIMKDYNRHIVSLCDKPVEQKAKDTRLYELVWSSFTKLPLTDGFLDEVIKRQTIFYETHPTYPYASINILDLLPREKSQEYSVSEMIPSHISSKVSQIINEAYQTARFLHKV